MPGRAMSVYGVCLLMLTLAGVLGRQPEVALAPALDWAAQLPRQLGPWRCASAEYVAGKSGEGASFYSMEFGKGQKQKVEVILGVVTSRLGALRDWSVASIGQGWELGSETVWAAPPIQGLPLKMVAGVRQVTNGKARRICINWYVSRTGQSPSFVKAELKGWLDRLLGRRAPWGQMFVTCDVTSDDGQAWQAASEVAARLSPHFYAALGSGA